MLHIITIIQFKQWYVWVCYKDSKGVVMGNGTEGYYLSDEDIYLGNSFPAIL